MWLDDQSLTKINCSRWFTPNREIQQLLSTNENNNKNICKTKKKIKTWKKQKKNQRDDTCDNKENSNKQHTISQAIKAPFNMHGGVVHYGVNGETDHSPWSKIRKQTTNEKTKQRQTKKSPNKNRQQNACWTMTTQYYWRLCWTIVSNKVNLTWCFNLVLQKQRANACVYVLSLISASHSQWVCY